MTQAHSTTIMNLARAVLRRQFGHADFREGQAEVIEAVLRGHNCIVVMPTGGGKSLCYQLPALLLPGRTLVISPLIALMKDQTEALQSRHIKAAFINSSIPFEQQKATLTAFAAGRVRILYIAPERFRSRYFVDVLRQVPLSLLAIDEAHCISHWGHDFRPDYLRLRSVIEELGRPPVLALTATATPQIRLDIAEQLGLSEVEHFVAGFDRANLKLEVQQARTQQEKLVGLEQVLRQVRGPGIIYGATRKVVEFVARELSLRRIRVLPYHAGLSSEDRTRAQDAFMEGQVEVIVATNAFGMGIDKPDIRFVIHYNLPESIESYYQESGRAGRDGHEATCCLLFTPRDVRIQEYFLAGDNPPPELIAQVYRFLVEHCPTLSHISARQIAQDLGERNALAVGTSLIRLEKAGHIQLLRRPSEEENSYQIRLLDPEPVQTLGIDKVELARRAAFDQWKLEQMIEYAHTDRCLRGFILNYFGDRKRLDRCGSCSSCLNSPQRRTPVARSRRTAMDELILESAPTGPELRQMLRHESRRLRELADAEATVVSASPASSDADEMIGDLETAHRILQCVAAMNFRFGQSTIVAVLRGSSNRSIKRWRLDQTPHHGRLAYLKSAEIQQSIQLLLHHEYLTIRQHQHVYPLVGLTEKGWEFLKKLT